MFLIVCSSEIVLVESVVVPEVVDFEDVQGVAMSEIINSWGQT